MNKTNRIPPGYKSSPVGPIPDDWEVKELGVVAEIKGGKRIPKGENLTEQNTGFPYIRVTDMFMGGVDSSNILFVPKHIEPLIKNYKIKKSELFITVAGTIGMVGEIPEELDNANLTENANKIIVRNADRKYVLFYLMSDKIQDLIKGTTTNNAQPKLALERIRKLKVSLPPLPEQTAIANLLSTWDKAIQIITHLIAQKEQRKKWLMQQLLTGEKRLKGFSGEWRNVKLGDVTIKFSRRNNGLEDARVYSVTNSNGFVLQSEHFEREVAGEDLSNYKIIKKNEFAYNPARINVGSIAYFENDIGVISSLYVCFSTKKSISDYYLLQLLQLDHMKHKIESHGEGGVRIYLWYELFAKIKFQIPDIQEQTAIVCVLQAADKEIQLLKTKAEQLKEQKKGLMQQLLTGRKRLKF